jgi:hypothetical protein
MGFFSHLVFLYLLECGHPADSQMAVLQADPVSVLAAIRDKLPCEFTLALSERKHFESGVHLFFLGEGEQVANRICSWTEHKDDGRGGRGVAERSLEVEDRRLDEYFAEGVHHEVFDEDDQFLLAQQLVDDHFLEDIQFEL